MIAPPPGVPPPPNFLEASSGPFPTSLASLEGVAPGEVPRKPFRKKFRKFHLRKHCGAVSGASPLDLLEQQVSSGIAISAPPGPNRTKLAGDLQDTPERNPCELRVVRPVGGQAVGPQRNRSKSENCAKSQKKGGKALTPSITVRSLPNSLESCRGAWALGKRREKWGSSLDFSSCGGPKSEKGVKTGFCTLPRPTP